MLEERAGISLDHTAELRRRDKWMDSDNINIDARQARKDMMAMTESLQ